jgi:hypothetical protein
VRSLRWKAFRDITTDDVLGVLVPIWTTIPRTARETRGRIERVFDVARAKGCTPVKTRPDGRVT